MKEEMRGIILALSAVALALLTPPVAHAQDEEAAPCTWEEATSISIEKLTENFREMAGSCVRVKALHAFGRYASENHLLADQRASLEVNEPYARSVAINYSSEVEHEPHRPRWEEVLGRFGSCELTYEWFVQYMEDNPDKFVFIGGLCHYTLNHYIVPEEYRTATGATPIRLRVADIPAELREFKPIEVEPDFPNPQIETLNRMFDALEKANFDEFLLLTDPPLADDFAATGEAGLPERDQEDLDDYRQEFAEALDTFRASNIGSDAPLFLMRYVEEAGNPNGMLGTVLEGVDDDQSSLWCRLRRGSSESELPARYSDVDNDPSRPYFCIETGRYVVFQDGTRPSASVPLFRFGFLERIE